MSDDTPSATRRRLLKVIGAGGAAALAGCKEGPQPTRTGRPETPTESPTETPTETPRDGAEPCPDATYVLNTGYDQDAGAAVTPCSPDDDWEVTDEAVSAGTTPRRADVIDPHPDWASPFPDSRWISVTCDGDPGLSGAEEHFEFTYCFCLNEGFHEPELDLKLRADDAIEEIRLNGNSLPFAGNGTYAGTPVEETYGERYRRYFRSGKNCLTVVIRDTGSVITGLNLVGTMTAKNGECCSGTCDLGVEKTHEGPFEFGGTGTYVVEVCNEGDGRCNRAAKLRDELPPGVTFAGASGRGWNVAAHGGTVEATHPNPSGLAPGACLPPLKIHVEVAPFEEFPEGKGVSNCVELIGGGPRGENDRACTRPCVVGDHTFEGGVHDDFDPNNEEPASPSDNLATHNRKVHPGVRGFDEGGTDKAFGHTFADLRPPEAGEICEAKLEICLRPEGSGLDDNDRIYLGVFDEDGNSIDPHWSRHLGNYDGKPGIFDTRWHAEDGPHGETRCITLDLSDLPEADGSRTNLLPVLRSHDRLSVKVQDDTAVDYAHLTVSYCCGDAEADDDDKRGPEANGETEAVADAEDRHKDEAR